MSTRKRKFIPQYLSETIKKIKYRKKSKNLLKFIETRRSVRKFKDKPVPKEDILRIIKAASMAPSGSNQQNWYFIVVTDRLIKEKLHMAVDEAVKDLLSRVDSKIARDKIVAYSKYFTFFWKAPVLICAIEKPHDSLIHRLLLKHDHSSEVKSMSGIQNVAASIENMLLAAHALGYGTCWMTGPLIARKRFMEILHISHEDNLAALIPMGVPDIKPAAPPRKPIDEIIKFV